MSMYGQERARLVLPAAEIPRLKKALREAHNRVAEDVYAHAKQFWRDNRTQSLDKYTTARHAFVQSLRRASVRGSWHGRRLPANSELNATADAVDHVLERIEWQARHKDANLRGATWDDVTVAGFPTKTNRATQFAVAGEGYIHIDEKSRTVTYDSGDNNHQIEQARESFMGQTFFAHLDQVSWTRGTGGVTRTVTEMDSDHGLDDGYHSNLGAWYGPLGAAEYKREYGAWPHGSPEAEAEEAKQRQREQAKARRKRERDREKAAAAAAPTRGRFCGALKADGKGLCGRMLTSGRCPDHGTIAASNVVALSGASASAGAAAGADPMG